MWGMGTERPKWLILLCLALELTGFTFFRVLSQDRIDPLTLKEMLEGIR